MKLTFVVGLLVLAATGALRGRYLTALSPNNIAAPTVTVVAKINKNFNILQLDNLNHHIDLEAGSILHSKFAHALEEFKLMNKDAPVYGNYGKNYWEFWITGELGKMKFIGIRFTVNDNLHDDINVNILSLEASVTIPPIYSPRRACSHTGDREYFGLFGPREQECSTSYGVRGLNTNEVDMVNGILRAAIEPQTKGN
jgi:hypothetical protein